MLGEVLAAAGGELIRPDPGRSVRDDMRSAPEVILGGARVFLHHVAARVDRRHIGLGLFDQLNEISALRYEGDEGLGRIVFVDPAGAEAEFTLRLRDPVALREARWARKLLQMASLELPLIATPTEVHGLGRATVATERGLAVDFHGHQDWEVRWDDRLLLRTRLGRPTLPQEAIAEERFRDNVGRLFPRTEPGDHQRLWDVMRLQTRQPHGSLVVVAADAAAEAERLAQQATRIAPLMVTGELLSQASRIDGALLLDPTGVCVAIGVVLDGQTHELCQPARGARYNSAVRYVHAGPERRMAMVFSDDRTLDIVPLLRPRVSRAQLAAAVAELKAAGHDSHHAARNVLDDHRFYLDQAQCDAVNAALERINSTPMQLGEIRFRTRLFAPHPDMDDSYLF